MTMTAAVIGLGQMGRGIAKRIEGADALTAVCDSSDSAISAAGLGPTILRGTLSEIAPSADILLFAVPSTRDIRDALVGATLRPGQVIVDLTTSDPAESRTLAQSLALIGVGYLDAAMTGGAAGADAGQLTLMVGGSEQTLTQTRPILDHIATSIFHLGPAGAGHAMKLVHNMILHTMFLANCEGLQLAERAGIDPKIAVEVLNAGNARSFVSQVRFPRDILSGTMQARSRVSNLAKDLGLAVEWAASLGSPTPFGNLTTSVLKTALDSGMADTDFSHLYPQYAALIGTLEQTE